MMGTDNCLFTYPSEISRKIWA